MLLQDEHIDDDAGTPTVRWHSGLSSLKFLALAAIICGVLFFAISRVEDGLKDQESSSSSRSLLGKLQLQSGPIPYASVHCVGENFAPTTSWKHKSCQFRNLCVKGSNLFVVQSPNERKLQALVGNRSDVTVSTLVHAHYSRVSLDTDGTVDWFPQITQSSSQSSQYHELSDQFVLVPLSWSASTTHVVDLVWNELLSLNILLSMFHFENKSVVLWTQNSLPLNLRDTWQAYLPALGLQSDHIWSPDAKIPVVQSSDIVCAKYAVAGLGVVVRNDSPWHTQVAGQGVLLKALRTNMARHLEILSDRVSMPYKIVITLVAPTLVATLQKHLALSHHVIIEEQIRFAELTLSKQAKIVSECTVLIVAEAKAAIAATFLPRGGTLVLLNWDGTAELQRYAELLKTSGYFQTHFYPTHPSMIDIQAAQALAHIISDELEFVRGKES